MLEKTDLENFKILYDHMKISYEERMVGSHTVISIYNKKIDSYNYEIVFNNDGEYIEYNIWG